MKKKDVSAHVYITNSKIQVLMGSCVKNKLQVVNCYEEPLEEGCILNGIIMNNYSLQNTLTEMWQKYNLPAKGVTLVVNGSSITVKPLKVPQIAPKNVPLSYEEHLRAPGCCWLHSQRYTGTLLPEYHLNDPSPLSS